MPPLPQHRHPRLLPTTYWRLPTGIRRAAPLLLILFFVTAILYPLTLQGMSLYWGDLSLYFYPMEEFVRAQLRLGRLPLWNPYVSCGQPMVGNPQSWIFYPSTLLLYVVPLNLYFTVLTVVHLTAAGWGTYLYLRRICGDRMSALLGALTYAGGGFIVARLQFPTMVQSAAYLPWLLLLVDRLVERPRPYYGALLALAVGLTVLAAHPQIAYMTFACSAIYTVARLAQLRRHRDRLLRATAELAAAFAVGILSTSVQLLPALQLFAESTREHLGWREANRFVLLPEQVVNLVLPNFFGNPARRDYWGPGNMWEPCVYVGLLPLALALYAMFSRTRRPAVMFYGLLAVSAFWLALGRFGGLYWLAYFTVPGLASFHDPARFLFLTTFGIAALSAIGLRRLRERHLPNRWRAALITAAAVNIWWFSSSLNPAARLPSPLPVPVAADSVGPGRTLSALHEEVWGRFINYEDFGPGTPAWAGRLRDTLTPNVGMRFGIQEALGYEPVPVRAETEVAGLAEKAAKRQGRRLPVYLRLLDVESLLIPALQRSVQHRVRYWPVRGTATYTLRPAPARAWLVRSARRVDGPRRVLAALSRRDFDPWREALVSGSDGLQAATSRRQEAARGLLTSDFGPPSARRQGTEAVQVQEGMGEVRAQVDAGAAPGLLVMSDTFYPGWNATVDGRTTPIQRTDYAFRGIALTPGQHNVLLQYRPAAFQVGLYGSLIALALMAGGLGFGAVARPALAQGKGA